jgi:hypothetical protein
VLAWQPVQPGSARIKSAEPVSSTTEKPLAGVPTSISPNHSLIGGADRGEEDEGREEGGGSVPNKRPRRGSECTHESWYEVMSIECCRFLPRKGWPSLPTAFGAVPPYLFRSAAAFRWNESASRRSSWSALRRLMGTVM